MKAICIKELNYKVTLGKVYDGEFYFSKFITDNDEGKECWFHKTCFVAIDEHRNNLIEKILEE